MYVEHNKPTTNNSFIYFNINLFQNKFLFFQTDKNEITIK